MPAQGQDASARSADIAQEGLKHACRADDLHTDSMLGPAYCIGDVRGPVAARVAKECFSNLEELLLRTTTNLLDHFGRVSAVVTLHDLEHGMLVFERGIRLRPARHLLQQEIGEGLRFGNGRSRRRVPLVGPGSS